MLNLSNPLRYKKMIEVTPSQQFFLSSFSPFVFWEYFGFISCMILMTEFLSKTMVAMEAGKRFFLVIITVDAKRKR